MSKLNKTASFPFTSGQAPTLPSERRTVPSQEDVINFYRTHERVSWNLTELLDIPWTAIELDRLSVADINVVETTMLVEANSPDYVANLIEYFKSDQDVCDFIMMWAIEEWKHYYALRDYLTKVRIAVEARRCELGDAAAGDERLAGIEASVRSALTDDVEAVRAASIENWGIPTHYVPAQLVANTTFQEFVTADFYRNHARQTQEPTLAKMERVVGQDNAMRVFTEGNYLSDGVDDPSRRKMKPELITRLMTRRLG